MRKYLKILSLSALFSIIIVRESRADVGIAGGMGIMPVVNFTELFFPDIRLQKSFSPKGKFEPLLAWPVHLIQYRPADFIYHSFFAEPQLMIKGRDFSLAGGSRVSFSAAESVFSEQLFIFEGGGIYSSREHGGFIGFGLGRSNGSQGGRNKIGIIARCIKTNHEIRGDITIDFWPAKYLP